MGKKRAERRALQVQTGWRSERGGKSVHEIAIDRGTRARATKTPVSSAGGELGAAITVLLHTIRIPAAPFPYPLATFPKETPGGAISDALIWGLEVKTSLSLTIGIWLSARETRLTNQGYIAGSHLERR